MAPVVLLLCLCALVVQSAPAGQYAAAITPALYAPAPAPLATVIAPVKSQYHAQDGLGQYSYGYASPGQHKEELRGADGTVVGNYGYLGPDGRHRQINYVADDFGFHAAGDDVPAAPVAQVHASPVASVHVPAVAPAVTYNAGPVAVVEPVVHTAPAVYRAPAVSVAVPGAEAHAAEVHQTRVTTVVEPAVYAAPAPAVIYNAAPVVAAQPAVYAAAPAVSVAVPPAETHAAEVHQTHITTVAEPAVYAAPAPAVTYNVAPVVAAQPAIYVAAPTVSVVVPGAEAHASEVHQTQITTAVVQPVVYAAPTIAVAAPAPAVYSAPVAVAAHAPAVYSAPVAVAAPAVSYSVPGAEAYASEAHQTQVTSVVQPAIYTVSAPVVAAAPFAYKHGYKLH